MAEGGFYSGKGKGSSKGGGKGGSAPAASGPPLPSGLIRKLEALGYPELAAASLSGQAYCKIVLWLEEEKIRYYEKFDRKALRDFGKAWFSHVQDYCKELNVPAEGLSDKNPSVKLNVLNNLTNLAIHDIYRDKVEAGELTLSAPAKAAGDEGEDKQRLTNLVPALNRLLECFGLPQLPQQPTDTDTVAALRCVHTRICAPEQGSAVTLDLENLPVGLQIDDPEVRKAAAVLRLLHGIELQQLQVNINQVLNELQQLTANPKTDARLGRVGH
jgi:RLL motif-containing protein 1